MIFFVRGFNTEQVQKGINCVSWYFSLNDGHPQKKLACDIHICVIVCILIMLLYIITNPKSVFIYNH